MGLRLVEAYRNRIPSYSTKVMKDIGNIVSCWHGTSYHALERIVHSGLLVPGRRSKLAYPLLFGNGIYLAPDSRKAIKFSSVTSGYLPLLKCHVALGREWIPVKNGSQETELLVKGYHSVHAPAGSEFAYKSQRFYRRSKSPFGAFTGTRALRYAEYVVYDPQQVVVNEILIYAEV